MQGDEITIGSFQGVPIGQGGFATVYRVNDREGRPFALKLVDTSAEDAIRNSLYHEFSVQSELIHPQVAHAHAFGVHQGRPYIILDWIDGSELFEHFTAPVADDFVQILRQFASVMLFIHHRGWVHGDLKPENCRWRTLGEVQSANHGGQLCLLDFGLARQMGDAERPRGAGTVGYCAPEFLSNLPADGRADWYAVGIILYEWVFGVRPYAADEPAVEIGGHLEGVPDLNRPRRRPAPPWADEVITRLLLKTAEERADDEFDLLAWLSQFDPELEPSVLLNTQLSWHARSEANRLRGHEVELLGHLHDEISAGRSVHWSISSHGMLSPAWINRASALCSLMGYDVTLERESERSVVLYDHSTSRRTDARIDLRLSSGLTHGIEGRASQELLCLTLLPWDREEVRSYVRGVVGDDDVAEAWADIIHGSTCGLPAAVGELIQNQVDETSLSLDADGWGIDEDAVRSWRDAHMPEYVTGVVGPQTDPEVWLCEWLALGEGMGATSIVQKLWDNKALDCDSVIAGLKARGVIVHDYAVSHDQFDLRLRLTGHAAIMRSLISPSDTSRRSLRLSHVIAVESTSPDDVRTRILGHAFARASVWDRSAEEYLRAASFAIAADDRDQAMQFIVLAQESAQKIEDDELKRHWVGHVRMIEGDLQKAAGQLDVARQIYRGLLAICRASGDQRLLAETLHDLGDLYRIMRRYDKGIRAERRARRIWESLGDRAELSRSLNSLGNLCRIARDFKGARAFFTEALGIQKELGLDSYAATNLNNIGLISWEEYKFDEAESNFREALAIQERLNVPVEIARALNNLGIIGFVQGHLDSSADYFARAAAFNATAGARSEESYNHRNLAEVALEQGDLRTAVSLGQQVYLASLELGDVSTSVEVAAVLADAYLRAGDYRSALRLHTETSHRSASLKNDELRVYLELQRALAMLRFNRPADALAHLDAVAPVGSALPSRYLGIDALCLRVQILSVLNRDEALLTQILTEGLCEADAIGAPHKAAYMAFAALAGISNESACGTLIARIDALLFQCPRWHWAAGYQVWQARVMMNKGKLDEALALTATSIDQLRRDGCWEQLWRSLVLQAEITHAQADYEPAMRALDEATRTLKIVSATVEDDKERSRYLDCDDARTLERIRDRITELVS